MGTNIAEEVDKLTQEGHQELSNGNLDSACSAFDKASSLACHLKEGFTERACFFNLGACCVAQGDPKKGLEYLKRALPPEKESDGTANFADLQYNLGLAYDAIGQPDMAVECYQVAVEEYRTQNNSEMQGETLIKLAVGCTAVGTLAKAADFYEDAASIYHRLGDKKNEVLALNNRASLLGEVGEIDKCAQTLRLVIDLCEDLSDSVLKGKIYNDLGLLYNNLESYKNAAECFEIAIPLVNTANQEKQLEAILRQNLGAIYNQLGKYKKALAHHKLAVKLHGELNNRAEQGQTFCNMGFAHSQLGDFEHASESFVHAIQASKDGGDKKSHWQATEGLAAVNFLQGNYEKAVEYYKSALSIISTSGESAVENNNRIVSKLSNAMECQLKQMNSPNKKNAIPRSRSNKRSPHKSKEVDKGKGKMKRVGRTRPRRGNHKLIARGIDGGQESESDSSETGSTLSSSSSEYEEQNKTVRNVTQSWEKEEKENAEKGTVPLLQSGPYQKLVKRKDDQDDDDYEERTESMPGQSQVRGSRDYSEEMPRAHREAYLASIAASQGDIHNSPGRSSLAQKDSNVNKSRTCVIQ